MDRHSEALAAAARSGDLAAFQSLVAQHQDRVVALAFAWTGDRDLARDVAQEVFLDCWLKLSTLRDPAAFPAWLKRIAFKHCDRMTRRVAWVLTDESEDMPVVAPGPAESAESEQLAEQLRLAIAALPEGQRVVLALTHLAGMTGPQIADFLEVPLTTVKKRLVNARQKLKLEGDRMMESTTELMRPTDQHFSAEVTLFIAMRQRDMPTLRTLLAQNPGLANATQDWSRELVYGRVLPFANRATALISAVELGDPAMVDLLLEHGADPDGLCGCETGESAVWAAALFNRPGILARLLQAGANPDVWSTAGNRPIHVAAMRGHHEVVKLLMEYGADLETPDRPVTGRPVLVNGFAQPSPPRTAATWARQNGHAALARLIDGDALAPGHTNEFAVVITDDRVETGIKAIDFFAPLARTSLVRMPFAAGVGMMVLLGELSLRFLANPKCAVVWTGFAQPPFDRLDLIAELEEFGIAGAVEVHVAGIAATPTDKRREYTEGLACIRALRDSGREVFAVIQSTQGFEQDVEASFPELLAEGNSDGGVCAIVMTPFNETSGAQGDLPGSPWTAQWKLDRTRAMRRLYPAIDPACSFSTLDRDPDQRALAANVREITRTRLETDPDLNGLAGDVAGNAVGELDPALCLIRYFAQSFSVAVPFGSAPGEFVSRDVMCREVSSLCAEVSPAMSGNDTA